MKKDRAWQKTGKTQRSAEAYQTGNFAAPSYAKQNNKKWLGLLWLLVLIPVVYIAIQVIIILLPRMRTEVVIQEMMTESIDAHGFVALESTVVSNTAGASGVLFYTVPTGQRVSVDTEVAKVFTSNAGVDAMMSLQRVNSELALLEEAQRAIADGGDAEVVLKQIQNGVYDYLKMIDSLDYTSLTLSSNEIILASNKLQIETGAAVNFEERVGYLNSQKQAYEAQAVSTSSALAPQTGYFVPSSKQDKMHTTYDILESIHPEALSESLKNPPRYYGSDVIGHIVTDYKWYFFTTITSKQAEKFSKGDKLEISFPDHGIEPLPIVVENVTPGNGDLVKLEISCEYMSPEILSLRDENARFIFRTVKGLRIDKNALRIIDGERKVYIRFGNQVFERPIKVLLEDEYYLLVSPNYEKAVNEVQLYDDVIVDSGGVELYDKKIL